MLASKWYMAWPVWCILRRDLAGIPNIPCFGNEAQNLACRLPGLRLTHDHYISTYSSYHGGFGYASGTASISAATEMFTYKWKHNFSVDQKSVFTPLTLCAPQQSPLGLTLVSFCWHACLVWNLAAAITDIIGLLRNICSTEKVRFSGRSQKRFVLVQVVGNKTNDTNAHQIRICSINYHDLHVIEEDKASQSYVQWTRSDRSEKAVIVGNRPCDHQELRRRPIWR